MKRTLCIAIAALYLGGCTTMTAGQYGDAPAPLGNVRTGDRVVLTTGDGARTIEVTSVSDEEICGKDECFAADRILSVEREDVNDVKAAKTIGGILLLAAFIALIAGLHGGSFGYPGFPAH